MVIEVTVSGLDERSFLEMFSNDHDVEAAVEWVRSTLINAVRRGEGIMSTNAPSPKRKGEVVIIYET